MWDAELRQPGHHAGEANPGKEGYTKDAGAWSEQRGQFCRFCSAWRGSLGLEPSIEAYLAHLLEVMEGVRRVLREDGVLFCNLGDSYAGSGSPGGDYRDGKGGDDYLRPYNRNGVPAGNLCGIPWRFALRMQERGWILRSAIVWAKTNPMPESLAGWRWEQHRVSQCPQCRAYSSFRKRICKVCGWKKPPNRGLGPNTGSNNKEPYQQNNPHTMRLNVEAWRAETGQQEHGENGEFKSDSFMVECPGCAKCQPNAGLVLRKGSWRPTGSYEYVFMLTKSASYYADGEAVKEAVAFSTLTRVSLADSRPIGGTSAKPNGNSYKRSGEARVNVDKYTDPRDHLVVSPNGSGRNLRDVWTINTQAFSGAHFATYPLGLVERCIKAGTSERGCCPKCGSQWARVSQRQAMNVRRHELHSGKVREATDTCLGKYVKPSAGFSRTGVQFEWQTETLGWRATCRCNAGEPVPAVILDPFVGSGSSGIAAVRLGRDFVGFDLSQAYVDMAQKRIMTEAAIGNTSEAVKDATGDVQLAFALQAREG